MKEINIFKNYLQTEKGYPETTVRTYIDSITEFINLININNITNISKTNIRHYLQIIKDEKLNSPTTRNKKLSAIRAFFRFLLKDNLINEDPTTTIENCKTEKRLPKVLSKNQIQKLYDQTNENGLRPLRDKVIIDLFFATGIRISELINIRLNQLNLKDRFIIIFGKGQKERFCPLDDKIIELIKIYLITRKNNGIKSVYLFNGIKDKTTHLDVSTVRKIIYRYGNKAEIEIKPHTLRHTFATELCNNGADIRVIQEMLGHSDIRSTQIYTKVNNELIRETYERCATRLF